MLLSNYLKNFRKSLFIFILIIFTTSVLVVYYYEQITEYSFPVEYEISYVTLENYTANDINDSIVLNSFVVRSPSCHIPNIDVYHESIREFIFEWKAITCSKKKPITKITYDLKTELHRIQVIIDDVRCCYSIITRPYLRHFQNQKDDDRHEFGEFVCFYGEAILPKDTEFVYVTCNSSNTYDTVHGMVIDKGSSKPDHQGGRKYSVLLLGIDSISRQNLIRTMPQTVQYLKENEWLSLEGYTKIGDNTLPNLAAVLTGMRMDQLENACGGFSLYKFDNCPFIWKEYKNMSYLTAYIEDTPHIGTFNYEKYGFLNSPTDYYTRPLMEAGEHKLKLKYDGDMKYCMGMLPSAEYLFQYVIEFVERLQHRPYFNLFWTNSFSHSELNQPSVMDSRYKAFLQDLQPYLNSTIVVFLSDHGMRFGKIRETYVGWLEERSPFIYCWLPSSFKSSYPEKYANFVRNKNRLTSPYDLYATLQDILYGQVVRAPAGCLNCDSLFNEISFNRNCEDAGISSHWCTCSSDFNSVSTNDPMALKFTYFVISKINDYLAGMEKALRPGSSCTQLALGKILSVRSLPSRGLFESTKHLVIFEVSPSGAVFEATERKIRDFNLEHSVSRINAYGSQSSCVLTNPILRKYCFCVDS